MAFTRSSAKASWTGIGSSTHKVPSLSNIAMRSAGGTKSGEPSRVTAVTKFRIDCFVAPSFHEGSGRPTPDSGQQYSVELRSAGNLTACHQWKERPICAGEQKKSDSAYQCGVQVRIIPRVAQTCANSTDESLA
jgi:hypothetical protein